MTEVSSSQDEPCTGCHLPLKTKFSNECQVDHLTLQLPIFFLPKGPMCCIFCPVVTLYPRVGAENVPNGQRMSLYTPRFSCEERNHVTFVITFCLLLSGHAKAYHTSTQRLAEKIRWIWKSMPFFFSFKFWLGWSLVAVHRLSSCGTWA